MSQDLQITLTTNSKKEMEELHSRKQRSVEDFFWYIQAKWLIEEDVDYIHFWPTWASVEGLLSDIKSREHD